MTQPAPEPSGPRLRRLLTRWGLLSVIVVAGAFPILLMWTADDVLNRQERNLRTLFVLGVSSAALLIWFGLLAPVSLRVRVTVLGGVAGLVIAVAVLFRIEGVSGDLVPIFRPRWQGPPDAELARFQPSRPAGDPVPVRGIDFPQFLGPGRSGVIPDVKLERDWTAHPPRVEWRRKIGPAWSGISVSGGRVITQEQRGSDETVVCYDLASGDPLWQHRDRARYQTTLGGIGPRATPTVSDGRVYTLGATGILNCLESASGERVWTFDITKNTGAKVPEWGFAGSPLVEGNKVIVQAGGAPEASLAAYDRATGRPLWTAGGGRASYASPMIATLGERRQIVMLNYASCTGHDIETGRVLWQYDWRGAQPKAAQPVPVGDGRVVISAGYGVGADTFRVAPSDGERWTAEPLWQSRHLRAKFANFVHRAGHLFGLSDGRLTCVDADTGDRAWRGERYGHGQLLLVRDLLLILSERGDIALVEADASRFTERARFHLFDDKTWNSPALAGRYLLVRNHREMACVELPSID